MSLRRKILIGVVAVFIAMQLVPIDRTNPPEDGPLQAPPRVAQVLERSCYDCHSHKSRWPWYGYVAPSSWLLRRDIVEGREHLNFSTWERYDAKKKAKLLEELWEEVDEGEMPLGIYVVMHPDAKLGAEDMAVLRDWTMGMRAGLGVTQPTAPSPEDEHDHAGHAH